MLHLIKHFIKILRNIINLQKNVHYKITINESIYIRFHDIHYFYTIDKNETLYMILARSVYKIRSRQIIEFWTSVTLQINTNFDP